MAGWRGLFAVEKNKHAFATLRSNLIEGPDRYAYEWPDWLPKQHYTAGRLSSRYRNELADLRGKVTLIAGGPPCQGFSLAGKRQKTDSRNQLFKAYMQIVETVQPLYLLIENVNGISMQFSGRWRQGNRRVGRRPTPYSQKILHALDVAGYETSAGILNAAEFGVPQRRRRYFLLGIKRGFAQSFESNDPWAFFVAERRKLLRSKGLPSTSPVTVRDAISDLEALHGAEQCLESKRFMRGTYGPLTSRYQELLKGDTTSSKPDSHRFSNHRPATVRRFSEILNSCPRGVQLSKSDRLRFGLKKHCTVPLDPNGPSPTLTTLPDDAIHYAEPRILTVREYARLQSIPDWFEFRGPFSTGGKRRARDCPRYTQIGNAVPPFVGEAIGEYFNRLHLAFDFPIRSERRSHDSILAIPKIR